MILRNLVAPFILCIVTIAQAQTPDISEIRRQGMDLYNQNKMVDAAPLLEQAVQANPSDTVALERLAFSLLVSSNAVQNPEEQKKVRLRARSFALRARDLGDNSNLLGTVLSSIPPDGGLPRGFSEKSEVDAVMKEGEAAFARGDFTRALAAYAHALELDPRQYEAALFTGDVYFKQNQMEKAGEWFALAVEIDENRETAHRYWGDALLRSGNTTGARTKFIDAVIAEPYNRNAWVGLSQWAQTNRITLAHLRVDVPPPALAIGLWAAYSKTRAEWVSGARFAEAFPQESRYRHSLAEEAEALRMVAEAAATQVREGTLTTAQVDVSVGNLVRLMDAGLLESYVLLARADEGIARDYPAYRQSYRDKLKQYLSDCVIAARR